MRKHFYFGLSNPQVPDTTEHYTLDGKLYDFQATLDLDAGTLLVKDNFGRSLPVALEDLNSLTGMLAHATALYEEFKEIYKESAALSSRYTALEVWPDQAFVDQKRDEQRDEQRDALSYVHSVLQGADKQSGAVLADYIWPQFT